jgi:uncharacterized membrane protein
MSSRLTLQRIVGWLGPDRSVTERVALFATAAVIGPTFEPGLQPRATVHQAIATGVVSAVTLTSVTAAQSAIEAVGRVITRSRHDATSQATRVTFGVAANATAAGVCFAAARLLPARADESMRRGGARTVAEVAGRTAMLTTGATALAGSMKFLSERNPKLGWINRVPIALPAGMVITGIHIRRTRSTMARNKNSSLDAVSVFPSAALSAGVGAGVWSLQIAERFIARGFAAATMKVSPRYEPLAKPVGHLFSLSLLGGVLYVGYEYAVRAVEQGGAAVEPAYIEPPTSSYVSGGPDSLVTFDSLSREGRRFVNMALTRDEIQQVMGESAVDPIRVFIGLSAAPTIEDRVMLAMDELERTGAFERSVLCLASPTGSGYINYVMAEAMEFMALGDCAIATLQYSLRPSPMSLDRTSIGVEQNRALLHSVSGYLRGMPADRRPRLVLFGESLGAQTMLDSYRHRRVEALNRDGVSASLFLGTPAATQFARSWRWDSVRIDPGHELVEVDSFADFEALPGNIREHVRHVLLTHHDDPIPKFGLSLLVRKPEWLGDPDKRPPGIPRATTWRPATTFVLTGVDMVNAMEVIPGEFGRRGHDYREDIPDFVRAIFGFSVTDELFERIQQALRTREREWAEKRVISEQLARAREAVTREISS